LGGGTSAKAIDINPDAELIFNPSGGSQTMIGNIASSDILTANNSK